MNKYTIDGPADASHTFIFAHGAGAGMAHPFMVTMAEGIAAQGIKVVRFNFPYMQQMLAEERRLPPNKAPILLAAFKEVLTDFTGERLVIGGKSMGGRIASHLLAEPEVIAGVCLGFPFHPVGKPERLKGEHLANLNKPCLLIQGDRDTMGSEAEVKDYDLSSSIQLHFLADGDHSFKPRKSSGYSYEQHMQQAITLVSEFILSCNLEGK
ncbi:MULTISPECIES: alpha/beta family hydrolase [unclassified Motilimonas]|uniref:alpha/beta family hydrolase n=1 Tax=unclassified Motilimonas TaxID=2643697 RepID=UPI001E3167C6|nr:MULTISPECIES: alpha/beta family hydrolase [unclassified Motilimonas]MCE0556059.1 dienelactone hydrolase family protein [Motilimonas sp. E26]MDO6527815.1 dienelactone hydrolase family protein [Motilimonas sp. 1_MG-2023]